MKKWSLFGVQFSTILLSQCASEIWPDNWGGLQLEGPYKRGTTILILEVDVKQIYHRLSII
jgi:hypothetical protein